MGNAFDWIQLKRLIGRNPATPLATQEGQLRFERLDDATDGKLYLARRLAAGTYEWLELSDTGVAAHSHAGFILRHVNAQRDAVASGGATISSTTGAAISGLSDTMVLANGLTYDLVVWGNAQLSAGVGGSVSVALNISGTGVQVTPVYIGTPTEGGERSVMPTARVTGVVGEGQTITVTMLGKRVTANGTIGSASFQGFAIPRQAGSVS